MNEPRTRVVLFGTGKGGQNGFQRLCAKYHIVGFADNDSSKQGGTFCGLPIYAPSELKKLDYDKIIICSVYYKDIRNQLMSNQNIPKKQIKTIPLEWSLRTVNKCFLNPIKRGLLDLCSRYQCPVCGRKVNRFKPISPFYAQMLKKHGFVDNLGLAETCNREAYACPHCGSPDRTRLYAMYMERLFIAELRNEFTIVDFAPCRALQKFIMRRKCVGGGKIKSVTSDLMREGVDIKADICAMPEFEKQSIDFFICSHILEHVQDDRAAMRELYRILKPGGSGIAMVPIRLGVLEIDEDPSITDVGERWRRFGQGDHVRRYSKTGFIQRLQEAGFRVEQLDHRHFGSRVFRRAGISAPSVLYVVHRDA